MGLHHVHEHFHEGDRKRIKVILGASHADFQPPAKFLLHAKEISEAGDEITEILAHELHISPGSVKIEPFKKDGSAWSTNLYLSTH